MHCPHKKQDELCTKWGDSPTNIEQNDAKWLRAGLYYQPRPQTSRKIKAFRHWHPATRDVPHFFLELIIVVAQATNIHPGGYSDLNLQLNLYFVLAGPCELQLHICKEFDQIPFSKCLKLGFGPFRFDICMLCLSMFFCLSVFIQRLLCATVDQ